ncbi:MAG: HEAT repeat domain-containing protein [Chloroflexota bacterium]
MTMAAPDPNTIPFQQLLQALLDIDRPVNPRFYYRLSDLEPDDLAQLSRVWPDIPLWRRQAIMEDIEELSANDILLYFVALGRFAVQDPDPKVRLLAVRTLWEYEEKGLIPILLDLLAKDPDAEVRAACAGALGPYVYAGELEEIPKPLLHTIEDCLLEALHNDSSPKTQHYALESLGYSSRAEVIPLIEKAYASSDREWTASALFAMGRSGDERWRPQVLAMLESKHPSLRSEAARAAGELEISKAVPLLIELLDDPDQSTRLASIWSLSQIGGEGVRQILEEMYEQVEDEDTIELLTEALDNLAFTEGLQLMPILDLVEYEDDDDMDELSELDELDTLDDLDSLYDDDDEIGDEDLDR